MPCSRTQHGLTRVGLEPPTSGSGVRGIYHQATALPKCAVERLQFILRLLSSAQKPTLNEFLKSTHTLTWLYNLSNVQEVLIRMVNSSLLLLIYLYLYIIIMKTFSFISIFITPDAIHIQEVRPVRKKISVFS